MNDLISRQEVLTKIREGEYIGTLKDEGGYVQRHRDFMEMYEIIRDLPSANQWIPCSERLPEKDGRYWISTKTITCEDNFENGEFVFYRSNVLAWLPLPEPWRGEA